MELQELLENARRNEVLLKRLQSFELRLLACQNWTELLRILIEELPHQFQLEAVSLKLRDPDGTLRSSIMRSIDLEHAGLLKSVEFLKSIPQPALALGPIKPPAPWVSGFSLPLVRNGQSLGLLCLYSSRIQRFPPDLATDFIQHLAAVIAACLVLVEQSEGQVHLALTDPLTMVDNRRGFQRAFQRECARATRHQQAFALFMLDLDHFKQINDQHGHATGDRVLKQLCYSLKKMLRPSDHVGRLGGEEFALLLTEFNAVQIDQVAERMRLLIQNLEVLNDAGELVPVTASASYMMVTPEAGAALELALLLEQLDSFLYQAKQRGRNKFINALMPELA